jgi:hypothetical protein
MREDICEEVLFDIDMYFSIYIDREVHIRSTFITNSSKQQKVLLLMEQGEGEYFYC